MLLRGRAQRLHAARTLRARRTFLFIPSLVLTNANSSHLQSLLDLLRIRKRFSEPESRFYLTQLVGAVDYLHSNSVIHRDLKLGNLMVDGNMNLKVGDFGLAALVKYPGERKKCVRIYTVRRRRM